VIERLLHGGGFSKPSGGWFFAFNDQQAVVVLASVANIAAVASVERSLTAITSNHP